MLITSNGAISALIKQWQRSLNRMANDLENYTKEIENETKFIFMLFFCSSSSRRKIKIARTNSESLESGMTLLKKISHVCTNFNELSRTFHQTQKKRVNSRNHLWRRFDMVLIGGDRTGDLIE